MDPCETPKWRPTSGDVLLATETRSGLLPRYEFTHVKAFSLVSMEHSNRYYSMG